MDNTDRRRRRKQHKIALHDSEGTSLFSIYFLFPKSNFIKHLENKFSS